MVVVFLCHWNIDVDYKVHSTAIVDAGATIGKGTKIWHWTHICAGARIGDDCSFGQNVYVANDVVIGNGVKVQNNVSIFDAVTLEDGVFCGPSMVFTNVINPRGHISRKDGYLRTLVRKCATIGANATIVCGNEIGSFAFVGAGAVVTRNVDDYALVLGNPARRVGWICACGEKLRGRGLVKCPDCGDLYRVSVERCEKENT
jgi:UDP-2-acetamido-3-amino-2,3-dideoxy-glucuronate N-acetyltransferase